MFRRFLTDESGASAAEYAILVALVAAAVLTAVGIYGDGLTAVFHALNTKLLDMVSPAPPGT